MTQAELECRFQAGGPVVLMNAAYSEYFGCVLNDLALPTQPPHLQQSLDGWPELSLLSLDHPQINHETRVRSANGEMLWQQWYNQGRFDEQGQLLEIRAVGRDITRYKLAEIRLQQKIDREQALGRLVDRLRQSFDLQDIFAIATQELRHLLGCDRASVYQFTPDWGGYFVAESVARGWIPLVGDGSRTIWADSHLKEHQGGRYRQRETFAVDDIYLSGHTPCHLDILEQFQVRAYAIVPIFQQEHLWGLLSIYQNTGPRRWRPEDVTLMNQVAHHLGLALYQITLLEQAQQAKDAAERANRAKSDFLSHMSHELRTPLNAILGYAQFLLRDTTLSTETQSYLATINSSGEHLLSLINAILSMAKIEAGQMLVSPTAFDLPELIQHLVDMLLPRANAKGLVFTFHLDDAVPTHVQSDRGKIQQILLNLLDNALKFTEAGAITLAVELVELDASASDVTEGDGLASVGIATDPSSAEASPISVPLCHLRFTVSDTGSGIAPDQAQLLFRPFSQTESGRVAIEEGTGLGLAISRQFAQLLGGELILVQSSPQGSTFELRLPVEPVNQVEMKPRSNSQQVIGLAAEQPTLRVLVADDNEPSRRLLIKLLETVGFEVQAATNGQEAVAQWQSGQPQLIFMDLRMPVMDGYQATQQIKAAAGDQSPIIVALTASAFDEEELTAVENGCDGFLRKPLREADLFDEIARHLGVRYQYAGQLTPSSPTRLAPTVDLAVMPADWIDRLYQSAIAINNQALYDLIEQIPPSDAPLAQTLQRWVQDFRCDKIVELVERVRDSAATEAERDHSSGG